MSRTTEKKQTSLLRRRVIAILVSVIAIALLAVAMVFVLRYADVTDVPDKDGTMYYIRKADGVYALYDKDGNRIVPEEQFGYYKTALGTLIDVDEKTGAYEIVALVDTEYTEEYALNTQVLMFPSVSKQEILSIEVHNDKGTFTFCRYNFETGKFDATGDFIIRGAPMTMYDPDLFARMYVSAGYTMTTEKVMELTEDGTKIPPIKRNEKGEICTHTEPCDCDYREYGLAPCTRYDEEGNAYDYEPAYYILTDIHGNRHKVLVGDMLVDQSGYYVQYVELDGKKETKRDAVYVVDTDMGTTMLAAIEDYVDPTLAYPMTSTTYFDVQDFTIGQLKESVSDVADEQYENVISFSYIDLELRENNLLVNFPYEFNLNLKGYLPDGLKMESALRNIYDPEYVKVCKLLPSSQDLIDYGFYRSVKDADGKEILVSSAPYTITFKHDLTDDNGKGTKTLHELILISKNEENGNYYTYTIVNEVTESGEYEFLYSYDTILEISRHSLEFLTWDTYEWITDNFIQFDLAFIDSIKLESPSYSAFFDADNSKSDITESVNANNMSVTASDSTGKTMQTVGMLTFVDTYGSTWVITPTEILAYDAQGNPRTLASGVGYYAYNLADRQALCLKNGNYITCSDKIVEVGPNTVYIKYHNGKEETLARYGTHVFFDFYMTMQYASIIDDYPLTKNEEAALVGNPDRFVASITLTTKDTDGTTDTNVYSFYRISAHKAYITINGRGGFCVKMNRVNKFITDAQKCMNLEVIDPNAKY